MKRLTIIICAVIMALSATAQSTVRYQGEVMAGGTFGIGDWNTDRLRLQTIQGAKINPYLSLGLGIGIDSYSQLSGSIVPIFANGKGYWPVNSRFRPFVSLSIGYGIGVSGDIKSRGGFLWAPSVGLHYRKFAFQIGLTSQHSSWRDIGYDMRGIQVLLGIVW